MTGFIYASSGSDFVYQGTFHGGDAVVNLFYERDHGYQHFG